MGVRSSTSRGVPGRRRRERGQSLVELGIILPILLVCLIGVVEVTTLFVHYVTVVNASRDGARYGSKSFTDAEIRSVTQNDLARLPGAITPTADIKIDHTPAVSGDNTVGVTACYNHHLLMHITLVIPDVVRICETTTMRIIPTPSP